MNPFGAPGLPSSTSCCLLPRHAFFRRFAELGELWRNARFKDILSGYIPAPDEESPLPHPELGQLLAIISMTTSQGRRISKSCMTTLHPRYLPRTAWPRISLNPQQCRFFCSSVVILGHNWPPQRGGLFWTTAGRTRPILGFCLLPSRQDTPCSARRGGKDKRTVDMLNSEEKSGMS